MKKFIIWLTSCLLVVIAFVFVVHLADPMETYNQRMFSGAQVKESVEKLSECALGVVIKTNECPYVGGYNFGVVLEGYAKEGDMYISNTDLSSKRGEGNIYYSVNAKQPFDFNGKYNLLEDKVLNRMKFRAEWIKDFEGDIVGVSFKEV